jgi:hypothetical protein
MCTIYDKHMQTLGQKRVEGENKGWSLKGDEDMMC